MWKKFTKSLRNSESYISMALGLLVVIVIGILLFNFFSGRMKNGLIPSTGDNKTEQSSQNPSKELPATHTVASGETLWTISEKYFKSGYNWTDIASANKLQNPDYLEVGQKLNIPQIEPVLPVTGIGKTSSDNSTISGDKYTVVQGDDLWNIAVRAYNDGYKWPEIAKVNKLTNPDLIEVGTVLTLSR